MNFHSIINSNKDILLGSSGTRYPIKPGQTIPEIAAEIKQQRIQHMLGKKVPSLKYIGGVIGNTKVGGDPEFFIETKKDKKLVPSFEVLGTKPGEVKMFGPSNGAIREYEPCPAYHSFFQDKSHFESIIKKSLKGEVNQLPHGYNHWFHPDGYQLEFGYLPVDCMESTSSYIYSIMHAAQEFLDKKGMRLSSNMEAFVENPDLELGCRPSFNAYGNDNTIINNNPNKRFAGGHYHFTLWDGLYVRPVEKRIPLSMTDPNYSTWNMHRSNWSFADPDEVKLFHRLSSLEDITVEERQAIFDPMIRALDASIGLLSVAMVGELDSPARREHRYGMAGDYRVTPFTLEYRTPSNITWQYGPLWHIMGMIGRAVIRAFTFHNLVHKYDPLRNSWLPTITDKQYEIISEVINNTDYERARAILSADNFKYLRAITGVCADNYLVGDNSLKIQKFITKGVSGVYTKPLSLSNAWDNLSRATI